MEFLNYSCPVCGKEFNKNDDIVVCPECGAPHHRECYEAEKHCFYEDKHGEDFSFEDAVKDNSCANDDNDADIIVCKQCNTENPKENFYCYKCSAPLSDNYNNQEQNNSQQNKQQFNMPPFGVPFGQNVQNVNIFDPMAGLKNDEPIAENVNAGEMAKFVGKNTQYFLRIFNNIKNFNNSRFNFSAFIFSGFYFLYRKMLPLGVIFSTLMILLNVASTYITSLKIYQDAYYNILEVVNNSKNYNYDISAINQQDLIISLIPSVLLGLKFAVWIICGFIANRSYYKHCTKKINTIKHSCSDITTLNKTLESKGGVNLPLAVCVFIAYFIIPYLPIIINMFM